LDHNTTNLDSYNLFFVVENDDIYTRALKMGVDPSSFFLEKIDCMKDLELTRHNIGWLLEIFTTIVATSGNIFCWRGCGYVLDSGCNRF
jgi:hypothetical protein